jgi:hypothetical protein
MSGDGDSFEPVEAPLHATTNKLNARPRREERFRTAEV